MHRLGHVIERHRHIGCQRDGFLVTRKRFFVPAHRPVDVSEVIDRVRTLGCQTNGFQAQLFALVQVVNPADLEQDLTQVGTPHRVVRVERQGLAKQSGSFLQLSSFLEHHAKIDHAHGKLRPEPQRHS